jgi:ribosomal protein L6P/L9E
MLTGEKREVYESQLLPHPADVEVDYEKRTVRFLGPATTFQRRYWNMAMGYLDDMRNMVLEHRTEEEEAPHDVDGQLACDLIYNMYMANCEKLPKRQRPEPLPE